LKPESRKKEGHSQESEARRERRAKTFFKGKPGDSHSGEKICHRERLGWIVCIRIRISVARKTLGVSASEPSA